MAGVAVELLLWLLIAVELLLLLLIAVELLLWLLTVAVSFFAFCCLSDEAAVDSTDVVVVVVVESTLIALSMSPIFLLLAVDSDSMCVVEVEVVVDAEV